MGVAVNNLPVVHSQNCVHPLSGCTQVQGDVHSHDYQAKGKVVVAVHIIHEADVHKQGCVWLGGYVCTNLKEASLHVLPIHRL